MDWTLDNDCNPIWLRKLAGVLIPLSWLLAGAIWTVIHRGQNVADWIVLGWSSFLLAAFWLRYRSGKVGTLGWEFTFGMFLMSGVIPVMELLRSTAHKDSNWWAWNATFLLWFLPTAISYIRHFYFHSNKKTEQSSV